MKEEDQIRTSKIKCGERIRKAALSVLKDTENDRLTLSTFIVSMMTRVDGSYDDVLHTIRDLTFYPVIDKK